MPVAMTDSVMTDSIQPELSTQVLPKIPTVEDMNTWDKNKVLRWIQQRNRILEDDDLNNFNKARMNGTDFLLSGYKFFHQDCHLSLGASLGLQALVNKVNKSKFIPWM